MISPMCSQVNILKLTDLIYMLVLLLANCSNSILKLLINNT